MASKKFFISVVLFILMLIFASKAESRGVTQTSKISVPPNLKVRKLIGSRSGDPCCYNYKSDSNHH